MLEADETLRLDKSMIIFRKILKIIDNISENFDKKIKTFAEIFGIYRGNSQNRCGFSPQDIKKKSPSSTFSRGETFRYMSQMSLVTI